MVYREAEQCKWTATVTNNNSYVASNIHQEGSDKVMVYGSLFDNIDDRRQVIKREFFGVSTKHDIAKVHEQQGV